MRARETRQAAAARAVSGSGARLPGVASVEEAWGSPTSRSPAPGCLAKTAQHAPIHVAHTDAWHVLS